MNKIITIRIGNLRNAEDFGLMQRIAAITNLLTDTADKAVVDSFNAAVTAFDEALKASQASEFSEAVAAADELADKAWRAISNTLKIEVDHPSEDVRSAATKGLAIVKKYGDITGKAYDEEYGNMYNALQDFTEMGTDKQKLCYIDAWVTELQTRYDEFIAARKSRNAEDAEKTLGLVKLRRQQCDEEFQKLRNYVNVMVTVKGEDAYDSFINNINSILAESKQTLAARSTRKTGTSSASGSGRPTASDTDSSSGGSSSSSGGSGSSSSGSGSSSGSTDSGSSSGGDEATGE